MALPIDPQFPRYDGFGNIVGRREAAPVRIDVRHPKPGPGYRVGPTPWERRAAVVAVGAALLAFVFALGAMVGWHERAALDYGHVAQVAP